jgi:hypothetical protein
MARVSPDEETALKTDGAKKSQVGFQVAGAILIAVALFAGAAVVGSIPAKPEAAIVPKPQAGVAHEQAVVLHRTVKQKALDCHAGATTKADHQTCTQDCHKHCTTLECHISFCNPDDLVAVNSTVLPSTDAETALSWLRPRMSSAQADAMTADLRVKIGDNYIGGGSGSVPFMLKKNGKEIDDLKKPALVEFDKKLGPSTVICLDPDTPGPDPIWGVDLEISPLINWMVTGATGSTKKAMYQDTENITITDATIAEWWPIVSRKALPPGAHRLIFLLLQGTATSYGFRGLTHVSVDDDKCGDVKCGPLRLGWSLKQFLANNPQLTPHSYNYVWIHVPQDEDVIIGR